jgi:hypothetical protein
MKTGRQIRNTGRKENRKGNECRFLILEDTKTNKECRKE